MSRAATEFDSGPKRNLLKLTQKRLERFVGLVPKFLLSDDPDIIHDLRVGSRRLQQTIQTLIAEKTPASRKAVRMLRRVRRALGACRNLDVNLDLIQRRAQESWSGALGDAWKDLGAQLKKSREPLLAAARKQIAKQDLVGFIGRARELIGKAELQIDRPAKLKARMADSMKAWDEAFGLASETRSVANLHTLRIATKRLRYRAELVADSGSTAIATMVKDFKDIQTAFGDWHDRSVLRQHAGEFLARPDFLAKHPDRAGALLAEMNREKQREPEAVESILALAGELRKRWDHRHDRNERDRTKPRL